MPDAVRVIEFTERGVVVGRVRVLDGRLEPDVLSRDVVAAHGGSPAEFVARYSDWSNGYVISRLITLSDVT